MSKKKQTNNWQKVGIINKMNIFTPALVASTSISTSQSLFNDEKDDDVVSIASTSELLLRISDDEDEDEIQNIGYRQENEVRIINPSRKDVFSRKKMTTISDLLLQLLI